MYELSNNIPPSDGTRKQKKVKAKQKGAQMIYQSRCQVRIDNFGSEKECLQFLVQIAEAYASGSINQTQLYPERDKRMKEHKAIRASLACIFKNV